jgi:hypothetical protein
MACNSGASVIQAPFSPDIQAIFKSPDLQATTPAIQAILFPVYTRNENA